jgi:ABC-type sugar transport system substrate-binding protein
MTSPGWRVSASRRSAGCSRPGASASKATVAKVPAAAEQLGSRPDPLARAMITGRTPITGLVVVYLENQFYPMALERLSRALQDRGCHILVFMAENSTEKVIEVVHELIDYRVDGMITASVSMSNNLTLRLLAPVILVANFNCGQDDARLTDITSDNVAGGRRATEFLIAGGAYPHRPCDGLVGVFVRPPPGRVVRPRDGRRRDDARDDGLRHVCPRRRRRRRASDIPVRTPMGVPSVMPASSPRPWRRCTNFPTANCWARM